MAGNIISFDIGSSRVKLVWYSGGSFKSAVSAPVPDGLVRDGAIVSMDAMADFLSKLAKQNGFPRRADAAVILPSSQVFCRISELPPMTAGQLAYNLPFEFKDYLTEEKNRYYFDYSVQELVRDDEEKVTKMRLFACATLKATIEKYRAMFMRAGFKLKVAIPEEAAYASFVQAYVNRVKPETADYCLVDVGHEAIRMYILRDGLFVNHRTVDLGLLDLIRSTSERQGVDEHIVLAQMEADFNSVVSDSANDDLYHRMAAEITKVVNFYNYNNRQQALSHIYLCGGGASIEKLIDSIKELSNMEVSSAVDLLPPMGDTVEPWLYPRAVGCALQE